MMIVRVKTNASAETLERIREKMKKQISEGLIVHDNLLEITFADDMCAECGSTDLEEIKLYADNNPIEHVTICNACEQSRE